jgi:AraC-like DNA-binding protein
LTTIAVRYALPDPALFDFVPVYLEVDVAGGEVLDLLPPDMPSLLFSITGEWRIGATPTAMGAALEPSGLQGASSKAQWISGEGIGFCIGLNPLVWPGLFGKRAVELHDRVVPIANYLGPNWGELVRAVSAAPDFEGRVAAANAFLLKVPKPAVRESLQSQLMAIRLALADPDCGSVEELAARTGISIRQLERVAQTCFGFPPKTLIRRQRFRRMLHRADAMSYSQWRDFLDLQYVDQSHMIRDFKHFMGIPPSQYFALDRPIVSAAFQAFWAMLGITPDRAYWARDVEAV